MKNLLHKILLTAVVVMLNQLASGQSMTYRNSFDLEAGATFDAFFSMSTETTFANGLTFNNDGSKYYVMELSNDQVLQYSMSTAYDISTASYDGAFSVATEDTQPAGIAFNGDGSKFFIVGNSGSVHSYSVTTAYDITDEVTYDDVSFSLSATPQDIDFSSDGMEMFTVSTNTLYQYSLTSAYDISSASLDGSFSTTTDLPSHNLRTMTFGADGEKVYFLGITNDVVAQFTLTTPYDITGGISYDNLDFYIGNEDGSPSGLKFSPDGSKMFMVGAGLDRVFQYDLNVGTFTEVKVNDGEVSGTAGFQIEGDQFTNSGSTLTQDVDYSISNLPSGLSTSIDVGSNGLFGILNITGNATAHQEANDISSLTFTFNNSAFDGGDASAVSNSSSASSGISIDFNDNNPSLTYDFSYDIDSDISHEVSFRVFEDGTPNGIAFSSDGKKVFVTGATGREVDQYSLQNPYDLNNINFDGVISVLSEENVPQDIAFSNDGMTMFIIGSSGREVNQYALTNAFDITSGVSAEAVFSVASQELGPNGIAFSNDGMTMFIVGSGGGEVNQYALTSAFDISSGVSVEGSPFDVSDQDIYPTGIAFNDDGTKMYIVGTFSDQVHQYSLSGAFDISTASYDDVSFDVSTEEPLPGGIAWSDDGLGLFIVGSQSDEINQYALPEGGFKETTNNLGEVEGSLPVRLVDDFFVNPGGTLSESTHFTISNKPSGLTASMAVDADGLNATLTFTGSATDHQAINTVSSLNLTFRNAAFVTSDAVDVANAVSAATGISVEFTDNNEAINYGYAFQLVNATHIGASGVSGTYVDINFNSDGSNMYAYNTDGRIYQFILGNEYDLTSGLSFGDNLNISSQAGSGTDFTFNNDGMKFFAIGALSDEIHQYSMTSAYDITSATLDGSYDVSSLETSPTALTFNSSGTKMYVAGLDTDQVYQFTLSTPFDVTSGVTHDGDPLDIGFEESTPSDILFNDDGSWFYMVGYTSDMVHLYELETPYDITSGVTLSQTLDVSSQQTIPYGIAFDPSGSKLFLVGTADFDQYDLAAGGFSEVLANNGVIEGNLIIGIKDETFTNAGGTLTLTTDYTMTNVPAGLTPSIAVAADGFSATLTFTGIAAEHQDEHDVSSLGFTFNNSAFTGGDASGVDNAVSADSGIEIDFEDNNATLSYGFRSNITNGATPGNSYDVSGDDSNPQGMTLNTDGTKLYIVGNTNDALYQYSLSTPYQVGFGVTIDGSFDISSYDIVPIDMTFSPSGDKLYVSGVENHGVYQFSLGTPFDITTGVTFDGVPSSNPTYPRAVAFNDDGTVLFYISGLGTSQRLRQYELSTPYDVTSTWTFVGDFNPTSEDPNPTGMLFNENGFILSIVGLNDNVHNYQLTKPYDITETVTLIGSFDMNADLSGASGMAYSEDGDKMFVVGTNTPSVFEYSLNVGGFTESAANTGEVEGSMVINIYDELFDNAGGTLSTPGDYTITGIPAGYTPTMTVAGDGTYATLTLAGSNANHQDSDDVNDFTFTFATSAFSSLDASLVGNSTAYNSGLGIDYRNNDPVITYSSSFELQDGFEFSGNTYDVSTESSFPTAMAFSNDGLTMFVLEGSNDEVHQYSLSAPFDLSSTITHNPTSLNVNSEDNSPAGLTFSGDGMKMYIIGTTTDNVYQYELTTPFDITSGVSLAGSFYTNLLQPEDLEFNFDGTKLIILDNWNDYIRQYSLETPYDITTGVSFDGTTIDVTSEDSNVTGFAFSQDGTRMFLYGNVGIDFFGYTLDVPFDITGGVTYDGSPIINNDIYRNTEDLVFSTTGDRLFIISSEADAIAQFNLILEDFGEVFLNDGSVEGSTTLHILDDTFTNASGTLIYSDDYTINNLPSGLTSEIAVASDGKSATLTFTGNATDHQSEHSLSSLEFTFTNTAFTNSNASNVRNAVAANSNLMLNFRDNNPTVLYGSAYNLSNASFDGSPYAITGLGGVPSDITFSNDGTTMFILGATSTNAVRQFTLGTPFDVTGTVTEVGGYDVSDKEPQPDALRFNPDGTQMYIFALLGDRIHQYALTTPFDITSGVSFIGSSILLNSEDQQGRGMVFNNDGSKVFTVGMQNDAVYQYSLTTPYDVTSGLSYDNISFDISDFDGTAGGLEFSADGYQLFIIGSSNDKIHRFLLDAPYDIASARYGGEPLDIILEQTSSTGMAFSADGNKLYTVGNGILEVNQYTLGSDGFVESGSNDGSVSGELTIRIVDDEFANSGGTMTHSSDYTIDNLPAGLTPTLTVAGDGLSATLTLSGNATNHMNSEDVAGLEFTFANAAFVNYDAADVINAVAASSGVGIDFVASTETDILTFSIPEETGSATIDAANHTVDIEVVFGSDITALTPTITISLGATISPESSVETDFTNPVTYTVTAEDATTTQDWEVTVSIAPNTENDITAFTFSEIDGTATIDAGSHTVVAEATAGTDISGITPTITISENGTISPDSGTEQDFSTSVTYTVTAEDGNPQDWDVTITEALAAPTDIALSNSSIDENLTPNSLVGTFSTEDESYSETYTYLFISGDGDADNGLFGITGDQLTLTPSADYETKNLYNIRVRTDDGNSGLFEKAFEIIINDVNEIPTDISLDNTSIDESNPIGTVVGSLSTTDEDLGQSYTYALVAGTGDTNNASFSISGSDLVSAEEFDFETKNDYSLRIQTNDGEGGTFEKEFSISINDLPAQITSITLDNNSVNENEVNGTTVGSLSTFGEDLSGSYTYSLVAGIGDDDNASFSISGDQVITAESFNFETKNSYSILVMSDDGSLTSTQQFSIAILDVSEAPTDIMLSGNSITENNLVGDVIGIFSSTDEDDGETFSYSLVAGTGDSDNTSFTIINDELQAGEVFDFETQSTYSIRVQTDDGNGGLFEKEFSISIGDENESIVVANPIADLSLNEKFVTEDVDISNVFSDQDNDPLTYDVSNSDATVVTVSLTGTTLTITEVGIGSSTVTITADDGSGVTTSDEFIVTVVDVNDDPVVANPLTDIELEEGFGSSEVSYANVFTDEDNDPLTISVTSSDESVVTVELIANDLIRINETGIGTSTITVTADDENGGSVSDTFTFTVTEAPNSAPIVTNPLSDTSEEEGFGTSQISYAGVFSDPDGDALTITVSSSDEIVVTVSVITNDQIQITEVGIGESTITLTADDGNGGSVSDVFTFSVTEAPNNAPIIVNSLADTSEEEGFGTSQISYADVFSDPDGDALTITTTSSDESVVTVSVIANDQIQVSEVGIGMSTITITADDGNGGSVSDTFTFTVTETPLGLEDKIQVEIYPNPTSDFIRVVSEQPLSIKVTDLKGSVHGTQSGKNVLIDVRSLSQGTYLLMLKGEEINTTRRFIKIN